MPIVALLDVRYKPEAAAEATARLAAALADTRAFEGNRGARLLVDQEDPTRAVLVEDWESREAQEAYVAWRRAGNSAIHPDELAEPPRTRFFDER
jgi:quinol monooxygenase YgiN